MRQHHWPDGPYGVHPGSIEPCNKFWCTIFGQHEHYVSCSCGWSVGAPKLNEVTDAAVKHLDEARKKLTSDGQ